MNVVFEETKLVSEDPVWAKLSWVTYSRRGMRVAFATAPGGTEVLVKQQWTNGSGHTKYYRYAADEAFRRREYWLDLMEKNAFKLK